MSICGTLVLFTKVTIDTSLHNARYVQYVICLCSHFLAVSGGTTNWTELTPGGGLTGYEDFNASTSLLEHRFSSMQPLQGSGSFWAISRLFTADSDSKVGVVDVFYDVADNKITGSSYVMLWTTTGGGCKDYTVLQGQLAALVTLNLTTEHVATINGTATADFTSCGNYQAWAELIESGNVTRIKSKYGVTGNVTGDEVKIEYRIRIKEG